MGDVGDERTRVAVRAQTGPRLVPDQVSLRREPGSRSSLRQVGRGEDVVAVLVRIAHDHGGIAVRPKHPPQPAEGLLHALEVGGVVGGIGDVAGPVGHHGVVGAAVRVLHGKTAPGHGDRQLDVVGRVGGDEVHARGLHRGQELEGVAEPHLQPRRVEAALASRIGRAQVGHAGTSPVALPDQAVNDLVEDLDPARFDLEADGTARAPGDGCPEQRAADPGERVEDQLTGRGEELDQAGHQPGRLVGAVPLSQGVAKLRGIGGPPDRLGEVQPLLAGQFVEGVGRVPGAHPSRLAGRCSARAPMRVPVRRRSAGRDGAPDPCCKPRPEPAGRSLGSASARPRPASPRPLMSSPRLGYEGRVFGRTGIVGSGST